MYRNADKTPASLAPAGVPCLTLQGACHAHNVGVSLLTAVGLEAGWVAASGAGVQPPEARL